MATPVAGTTYSTDGLRNFDTVELQILACTSTSASGNWALAQSLNALDCMVFNGGTSAAYLVFSTVASPTALNNAGGASGTKTTLIAPGAYVVLQKLNTQYFAGICDGAGTTTLYLHAGRGA